MPPPGVEIPLILFKSHVGHGFAFDAPHGGCALNYSSSFFLVFPLFVFVNECKLLKFI